MAEIGMCFQAPLVRAFLVGQKSQTRRTLSAARCLVDGHGMSAKRWAAMDWDWASAFIDPGPSLAGTPGPYLHVMSRANGTTHRIYPRSQTCDRMWVRESGAFACRDSPIYAADGEQGGWKWTPSIHMPRWAARIEREIVGLRFERLHDISEADALAEGVEKARNIIVDTYSVGGRHHEVTATRYFAPGMPDLRQDSGNDDDIPGFDSAGEAFAALWDSVHGAGSWDANPLLLVYEFSAVAE